MAPTLYCLHASPPVRAVLITLKAIGLQVEEIETNLLSNDHLTEKFTRVRVFFINCMFLFMSLCSAA